MDSTALPSMALNTGVPSPEALLQIALSPTNQPRQNNMMGMGNFGDATVPPPVKRQRLENTTNSQTLLRHMGGVPVGIDQLVDAKDPSLKQPEDASCDQCHNGEDFSNSYTTIGGAPSHPMVAKARPSADMLSAQSLMGSANVSYLGALQPQQKQEVTAPNTGMDVEESSVNARDRKIAAQRRYRTKKKNELQRLKHIEREHMRLKHRMELLKPFEIIAKVEQARMDTGKRPRQWCYVETWPECKIISEMLCSEALGYSLLGRHCWDYKRFPGLSNSEHRARDAESLKRHWNATVAKGGYSLYDFLDNQFFERLSYRDGKPVWRWSQVVAYRINDPYQKPALLQCLENDCHEAVMFGRRHGVTEYLKSVGDKHAFHYILKSSNSIHYSCYVSADVVREHTDSKPAKERTVVVQRAGPELVKALGWDMNSMPADDRSPGRGVPILSGANNRLAEIIATGRTHEPMYYKRLRIVKVQGEDTGNAAAPVENATETMGCPPKSHQTKHEVSTSVAPTLREEMILVEAWAHMARPAGDGGVFVEVFERDAAPPALRELLAKS